MAFPWREATSAERLAGPRLAANALYIIRVVRVILRPRSHALRALRGTEELDGGTERALMKTPSGHFSLLGLLDRLAGLDVSGFHFIGLGDDAGALVAQHRDLLAQQKGVSNTFSACVKGFGV